MPGQLDISYNSNLQLNSSNQKILSEIKLQTHSETHPHIVTKIFSNRKDHYYM